MEDNSIHPSIHLDAHDLVDSPEMCVISDMIDFSIYNWVAIFLSTLNQSPRPAEEYSIDTRNLILVFLKCASFVCIKNTD